MAATMKGAISFGLLHVPVSLHTAVADNDIHFNQLCREDGSRVRYKKVCAGCGKEVESGDIVKGFEIEPGRYIEMTEEDFEKAKTRKDKTIQILHFADIGDIRPIYFDKTYHAVPEVGGDKPYELLRRCMLEEGTVAIAKGVIGQSEHLMALIPTDTGILAETLFFHDEVKSMPKEPAKPELSEQELTMGKTIIQNMKENFDPSKYHDEYKEKLWSIIQAKANNQEITSAPEDQPANVISMMDALQKMVEQAKAGQDSTPPKKPRTRKKAASAS
ncbi:non-homologous end joining protein Ku [Lachnotalea sp. AF33-28]|uniref:non-homologous end joining protein Ku n=1 Tax=Lachnotalea sp. AF33-28 TaxID=2292046 RepID=UPI000E46D317|nr:Ku protein [Lachnotalea sp. AF33-28]RHP32082.1 Ku protein [Lachnotalea sp. AF33-28]